MVNQAQIIKHAQDEEACLIAASLGDLKRDPSARKAKMALGIFYATNETLYNPHKAVDAWTACLQTPSFIDALFNMTRLGAKIGGDIAQEKAPYTTEAEGFLIKGCGAAQKLVTSLEKLAKQDPEIVAALHITEQLGDAYYETAAAYAILCQVQMNLYNQNKQTTDNLLKLATLSPEERAALFQQKGFDTKTQEDILKSARSMQNPTVRAQNDAAQQTLMNNLIANFDTANVYFPKAADHQENKGNLERGRTISFEQLSLAQDVAIFANDPVLSVVSFVHFSNFAEQGHIPSMEMLIYTYKYTLPPTEVLSPTERTCAILTLLSRYEKTALKASQASQTTFEMPERLERLNKEIVGKTFAAYPRSSFTTLPNDVFAFYENIKDVPSQPLGAIPYALASGDTSTLALKMMIRTAQEALTAPHDQSDQLFSIAENTLSLANLMPKDSISSLAASFVKTVFLPTVPLVPSEKTSPAPYTKTFAADLMRLNASIATPLEKLAALENLLTTATAPHRPTLSIPSPRTERLDHT